MPEKNTNFKVDRGSFRDRHGRVYVSDRKIFRGLSAEALANFRSLEQKTFFKEFRSQGKIVGTKECSMDELPQSLAAQNDWSGFLEHIRIPFISYPYEWTFGMLKDSALLHLELLEAAIQEQMIIKDSTPYNIQFVESKPIFIDIPSFEPLVSGSVWVGYKQFCEMFLFPLMLQAYKGINFQPFMRARIDGVDIQTAAAVFGKRDWFKRGVFSNVWLQSILHKGHGKSKENIGSNLKSAGFNEQLILANVKRLKKLIQHLKCHKESSEWGDYETFHNYTEEDHHLKESFVDKHISSLKPGVTWDIGCNTGQFSRIAEKNCEQIIAMDVDHLAVERLYQAEKGRTGTKISPILQNIIDPSPNWGWNNCERTDLVSRSQPDLVLCLALIHHVVISGNIPLGEFIKWLAGVTRHLIIEFVSRDDEKVKTLLQNKVDIYTDYSMESLEAKLTKYFVIKEKLSLESGNRHLYWCEQE